MANLQLSTLESAVHLIQVALTPVFLLSGIAALLNVFASRLARVADRLDHLSAELRTANPATARQTSREIEALHGRSVLLDTAVVLGSIGAASTCADILTLFLLALNDLPVAGILLFFFGIAVLCSLGSVVAFGWEMLISSALLRSRMHVHVPGLQFFKMRRPTRTPTRRSAAASDGEKPP